MMNTTNALAFALVLAIGSGPAVGETASKKQSHLLRLERAETAEHAVALESELPARRMRAVKALAALGKNALEPEPIFDLLARATSDTDPRISLQAEHGLERLRRMKD